LFDDLKELNPLLCINAADDPVSPVEAVPIDAVHKNPIHSCNVAAIRSLISHSWLQAVVTWLLWRARFGTNVGQTEHVLSFFQTL